jgi:tetratricopeptide (TPR) repeat protein
VLGKLSRYAEAVASYDKAITINPKFAGAWMFRGVALGNLGKYAEAVDSVDKAIAINPDYAGA